MCLRLGAAHSPFCRHSVYCQDQTAHLHCNLANDLSKSSVPILQSWIFAVLAWRYSRYGAIKPHDFTFFFPASFPSFFLKSHFRRQNFAVLLLWKAAIFVSKTAGTPFSAAVFAALWSIYRPYHYASRKSIMGTNRVERRRPA